MESLAETISVLGAPVFMHSLGEDLSPSVVVARWRHSDAEIDIGASGTVRVAINLQDGHHARHIRSEAPHCRPSSRSAASRCYPPTNASRWRSKARLTSWRSFSARRFWRLQLTADLPVWHCSTRMTANYGLQRSSCCRGYTGGTGRFTAPRDWHPDPAWQTIPARVLPADITDRQLPESALHVVAGPQSSWSRRRKLTLSEFIDAPWILSTLEAESGSPFAEACRAAKLPIPTAAIFSNSLHLRISLLATGHYLTLVPGSALRFGPGADLLKALPVALPRWHLPTAIFTLKGRALSPVAQAFADCVRDIAKPLARN